MIQYKYTSGRGVEVQAADKLSTCEGERTARQRVVDASMSMHPCTAPGLDAARYGTGVGVAGMLGKRAVVHT